MPVFKKLAKTLCIIGFYKKNSLFFVASTVKNPVIFFAITTKIVIFYTYIFNNSML